MNEWAAEVSNTIRLGASTSGGMTDGKTAYNLLKLTFSGYRKDSDNGEGGGLSLVGTGGLYWMSSNEINEIKGWSLGRELDIGADFVQMNSYGKSWGLSVRCIKDN